MSLNNKSCMYTELSRGQAGSYTHSVVTSSKPQPLG